MRPRVLALSLALLAGCGGALAEGKSEFEKGRYAEAKQTFLAAEQDSASWDDTRRAEYALFRGLTHAALGDRAAAAVWLREAKALEDARPGTLSTEDLERLRLGLAEVDGPP